MASGASTGKSSTGFAPKRRYPYFVICIQNKVHEPSLRFGKVYQVIKPKKGDLGSDVRVIDEEGEDYLYGAARFAPVGLTARARRALVGGKPSSMPEVS